VLVGSRPKSGLEVYLRSLPAPPAADRPLIPSKTGRKFSANGLCQVMLHIYDRAGLDRTTSHSGRRTFITTLAHKGVNVRVLAALAGHRHIGTTQR
jgi:integrase/recombinase XerD